MTVTIRKCEALQEMQACFALQKEVWNFSDADLVPVQIHCPMQASNRRQRNVHELATLYNETTPAVPWILKRE